MKGWVYVISTKSMPNLVKVGYSTKDPELRAKELYTTGTPHPYVVDYEVLVENPFKIEQQVHRRLKEHREAKEWFFCSAEDAVLAIREIVGEHQLLENFKRADRQKIEEIQKEAEYIKQQKINFELQFNANKAWAIEEIIKETRPQLEVLSELYPNSEMLSTLKNEQKYSLAELERVENSNLVDFIASRKLYKSKMLAIAKDEDGIKEKIGRIQLLFRLGREYADLKSSLLNVESQKIALRNKYEKEKNLFFINSTNNEKYRILYSENYCPIVDWIKGFVNVRSDVLEELLNTRKNIEKIKLAQENYYEKMIDNVFKFAAGQSAIKSLDREQKVGAFSTWAQMSTVENITNKLLEIIINGPLSRRPLKECTQQEQIDGMTAAFIEAANKENTFDPNIGSVTTPFLIKFIEALSGVPIQTLKDTKFTKLVWHGDLASVDPQTYMRLPMGLTVKAAKSGMTWIESDLGVESKVFEDFYQLLRNVIDHSSQQALDDGRLDLATYDEWKMIRFLPSFSDKASEPPLELIDGYRMAFASAMLRTPMDYKTTDYLATDSNNKIFPHAAINNAFKYAKLQTQLSSSILFLKQLNSIHLNDVGNKAMIKSSMGMSIRPMTNDTGGKVLSVSEYVVYIPSKAGRIIPFALELPQLWTASN